MPLKKVSSSKTIYYNIKKLKEEKRFKVCFINKLKKKSDIERENYLKSCPIEKLPLRIRFKLMKMDVTPEALECFIDSVRRDL